MPDIGISRSYQFALIDTMNELIGEPRLTDEVRRRAVWLKWALEGRQPGNEPLEFIADAPSILPDIRPCSSVTASIE